MSVGGVLQSGGVRGLLVWLAVMATLHSKSSQLASEAARLAGVPILVLGALVTLVATASEYSVVGITHNMQHSATVLCLTQLQVTPACSLHSLLLSRQLQLVRLGSLPWQRKFTAPLYESLSP